MMKFFYISCNIQLKTELRLWLSFKINVFMHLLKLFLRQFVINIKLKQGSSRSENSLAGEGLKEIHFWDRWSVVETVLAFCPLHLTPGNTEKTQRHNRNDNNVLFYALFLQFRAHSQVHYKAKNKTESKQTSASMHVCTRTCTHTHTQSIG